MGTTADYFQNIALDSILGDAKGASVPATVYVALFISEPDAGGGGDEVTTSGTNYSRVAVTNNSTNWPAASSGIKLNGSTLTFPTATASWGTVTHVAIYDAPTGGNMLIWGRLISPISPTTGNTPFFSVGAVSVGCD